VARDVTSPLTDGDLVEARLAQVWFWEGYYSRLGVDLQGQYGAELIQVTDLDLLATSFGPQLETSRIIGEAKSGTGKSAPKPLDRIVWLTGLRSLVGADRSELTVAPNVSERVRELGRHLQVSVQSLRDLEERESVLQIEKLEDSGSHGVSALEARRRVKAKVGGDPTLQPIYRFITSGVWFEDSYSAVKQLLGSIKSINDFWTPRFQDEDFEAIRWMMAESVSLFIFHLTVIAGESVPMQDPDFLELVNERLADGVVSAGEMRRFAPSIDKYIHGLLVQVGAPQSTIAQALGAFEPDSPAYASSLGELALRVKRSPRSSDLPRQADYVLFERLVRNRIPRLAGVAHLGVGRSSPFGAISAFLTKYANLPDAVREAMTSPVGQT
jgi:hypothetical protein